MKKKLIIFIEVFAIIFLISLASSKYLVYFEKKPLIVLKKSVYNYYDGSVTEYYSVLHKVIRYERHSLKKWELVSIFKKHDNGEKDFIIIYSDNSCKDGAEEIYRSDKFIYYLPCHDSESIIIKYSNNEEITLKEAMESKKVTVDDLIEKRLFLEKVPINK